jgi:hypothetical protein
MRQASKDYRGLILPAPKLLWRPRSSPTAMRFIPALLALLVATLPVAAQSAKPVLTGDANAFQTVGAKAAQKRYFDTLQGARAAYAAELDPAIKAVLAAGSLDEANALNQLKKDLLAGAMPPIPGPPSKGVAVNAARTRFERTVLLAQRQYALDLQPALKAAMGAALLDEANAINAELKGLAALTPAPATPAASAVSPATPTGGPSMNRSAGPGLMVTRYPIHPSQKDGNRGTGYVPYNELGKPLGAPKNVKTLAKWSKDILENAVVAGFIRIDKPGTYEFNSSSGWDRNELLIDGNVVCKFRDGEEKICSIDLKPGLHPIVSVGYAHACDEVRVKWKPPGATALTDIPPGLLSH